MYSDWFSAACLDDDHCPFGCCGRFRTVVMGRPLEPVDALAEFCVFDVLGFEFG